MGPGVEMQLLEDSGIQPAKGKNDPISGYFKADAVQS